MKTEQYDQEREKENNELNKTKEQRRRQRNSKQVQVEEKRKMDLERRESSVTSLNSILNDTTQSTSHLLYRRGC